MSYSANILVVDDKPGMLAILVAILDQEGYRVSACQSGAEALKCLMTNLEGAPLDIIISDLNLPDISGLQILWALKKINPDAAFIMITGGATLETAIEALNQGAFAYHLKPLDVDALISSVRKALRKQLLLAENRNTLERVQ